MYLDHGTLIYVKDRCAPEDVASVFFAKVVPVNPEDLPAVRRWRGLRYEPLRGTFSERFGDRCLSGISLPTYPVDRIVTGQQVRWREQGRVMRRNLWQAEATLGADG